MTTTRKLHELGQSLWLDSITRELLNDGTLRRHIDEPSMTGLTSPPRASPSQWRAEGAPE